MYDRDAGKTVKETINPNYSLPSRSDRFGSGAGLVLGSSRFLWLLFWPNQRLDNIRKDKGSPQLFCGILWLSDDQLFGLHTLFGLLAVVVWLGAWVGSRGFGRTPRKIRAHVRKIRRGLTWSSRSRVFDWVLQLSFEPETLVRYFHAVVCLSAFWLVRLELGIQGETAFVHGSGGTKVRRRLIRIGPKTQMDRLQGFVSHHRVEGCQRWVWGASEAVAIILSLVNPRNVLGRRRAAVVTTLIKAVAIVVGDIWFAGRHRQWSMSHGINRVVVATGMAGNLVVSRTDCKA